jgi:hypothetical protein
MNIEKILVAKYAETNWTITDNKYESLEWFDDSAKPTRKELEELAPIVEYENAQSEVENTRRAQYALVSDPLFFGYQRGENTKEEWLAAVQAIKDQNPYPEKP